MTDYTNLFNQAKKYASKRELTADVTVGHVGCAILTESGTIYTGISVGTSANLGFCAEVCAISEMIKCGETKVEMLVTVEPKGKLITPCGRCRELMYQINRKNLSAKIMLAEDEYVTLEELLPHRWQDLWDR